jgi:hypothetical protein
MTRLISSPVRAKSPLIGGLAPADGLEVDAGGQPQPGGQDVVAGGDGLVAGHSELVDAAIGGAFTTQRSVDPGGIHLDRRLHRGGRCGRGDGGDMIVRLELPARSW